MLTRRQTLAGMGACSVAQINPCSAEDTGARSPVSFKIPPNACDSHVHVIADPERFPMSPARDTTPPPATAKDLNDMLHALGLDRVVIIAPTLYGTDNSATVDAVSRLGLQRARGVAWIENDPRPEHLTALKRAGICGFRHFLYNGGTFDPAAAKTLLKARLDLAASYGWHIDISSPPETVAAVEAEIGMAPVPVVLDYFGWAASGVRQAGFGSILSLMRSGCIYVKLSEPYRLANGPDYSSLAPVVRALLEANPDRVLWGSGWPFISSRAEGKSNTDFAPNLPVDPGHLLSLLADWVPESATRAKILVDNPARLYGFEDGPPGGTLTVPPSSKSG